ncbi:MAG: LysR family transcriptional regulator [Fuerstiella sp.]
MATTGRAYKEITFQQLRSFCETARLGSFAAAAKFLDVAYPLQTSVTWENPNGPARVIHRGTLEGPEDKLVELKGVGWNNDYYNLDIRVIAGHKEIYRRSRPPRCVMLSRRQKPRGEPSRISSPSERCWINIRKSSQTFRSFVV